MTMQFKVVCAFTGWSQTSASQIVELTSKAPSRIIPCKFSLPLIDLFRYN